MKMLYLSLLNLFCTSNINNSCSECYPQERKILTFVADNTGEVSPFDWYNARLLLNFRVEKLDGTGIIDADGDDNGIVNGSSSFIKKLSILANIKDLYDCDYANHCVHIKNLLEYNPSYAENVASNEFYFLDTKKSSFAEKTKYEIGKVRNGGGTDQIDSINGIKSTHNKVFL